jgi:hypothetical protein
MGDRRLTRRTFLSRAAAAGAVFAFGFSLKIDTSSCYGTAVYGTAVYGGTKLRRHPHAAALG